jgi:hypothetical protein
MNKHIIVSIILYLVLILIYLYLYWFYEKDHILYHIKCLLNNVKNTSGLPTHMHIITKIIKLINNLPKRNYTLIDFGCGDGDFINQIYKCNNISKVIGIELNSNQAKHTQKRFSKINSIQIKNMDMINYIFQPIPTILYMYEPLWDLTEKNALPIYHTVMKNISHLTTPCYIIYVSGIIPKLDKSFFKLYPFKMLYHSQIPRLIGLNLNHIYVFEHK